MAKIIRTATVAITLNDLLKGQLAYLNQSHEIIAVSGEDHHLQAVREREGVRTISVPMQRAIRPFQDVVSLYRLYRAFKKEKPAIVHSVSPKAGLLSMVAAYFAGVPIRIHLFTGLIFPTKTGLSHLLLLQMDRILCAFATHVYPEGNGVRSDLIRYGVTQKPLRLIANGNITGVDTNYFTIPTQTEQQAIRNSLEINPSNYVFLYVGRLVGDKGINELISAFTAPELQSKKAKLLIVGYLESKLDPLKTETIRAIETNENIIFVGFQADVRPYYAAADCLVLPSYREGFPNVLLQGGAMGLPSIVTDVNGSNEIIQEGKNGTIVPVKQVQALEQAMLAFLEKGKASAELKQEIREHIHSKYKQDLVWNAINKEYNRVLNSPK
ncbi:MAG: glycosyltransferase family 4 protein [Flavobacterium sp.]|nr:glycosyltransferase family 4 protein [Flavobacterium sp.]